jgi:hypothetical protein
MRMDGGEGIEYAFSALRLNLQLRRQKEKRQSGAALRRQGGWYSVRRLSLAKRRLVWLFGLRAGILLMPAFSLESRRAATRAFHVGTFLSPGDDVPGLARPKSAQLSRPLLGRFPQMDQPQMAQISQI